MKTRATAGLLVCLFLAAGAPARAGVYNFAEPRDNLGKDFLGYRFTLLMLRDIGNVAQFRRTDPHRRVPGRIDFENPALQRHLLLMNLHAAAQPERLIPDQKLNLSGYLLRCRREAEVRDLLEPLARMQPDNFLLLANLATAYFYLEELERALFYQQQALEAWPQRYDALKPEQKEIFDRASWNQRDHEFYRSVEVYFLDLLRERGAEKRSGKTDYTTVDPLFKDEEGNPIRFVNEKGEYEPGKLAAAEKAKLPPDHMEIVKQLLLWLPDDNRLFWLYGELLAASGDIRSAQTVFFTDLEKLVHAKEFREHRAILGRTPTPTDPVPDTISDWEDETNTPPLATTPPYPYRHVFLSFFFGIAVGLFGVWQYRELRRRRLK